MSPIIQTWKLFMYCAFSLLHEQLSLVNLKYMDTVCKMI
jgi:hypothetical protein